MKVISSTFSFFFFFFSLLFFFLFPICHGDGELDIDIFTVLLASNSSCNFEGCGDAPPTFVPDDNVCVVAGNDVPVDCSCLANDTTPIEPNPCPGCPTNETTGRLEYPTLQEALMRCPYEPLIIEITGTHVVNRLMFPDTEGLVYLRGYLTELAISNCTEVSDEEVIDEFRASQSNKNFTHLLNITYERVPVPGSPPAVLLGSKWKVQNPNTSLAFENITVNGCCSLDPLFQLCGWEDVDPSLNGCCETNFTQPAPSPSPTPVPDPCMKTGDFIDNCMSEMGFRMDCERWYTEPGGCIMGGVFFPDCPAQPTTLFNCSASEGEEVSGVWSCNWEEAWMRLINCKYRVEPHRPFIPPAKPPGSCVDCEPEEEVEIFKPCDPPEFNMTQPHPCRGCLTNNNITLLNSTIQNFKGQYVLKGYALEDNVDLRVEDSNFVDIPGHALHFQGLRSYIVNNNCFARCGGLTESCVYLKANFITRERFEFVANQHYLEERTQQFPCLYSLNGEILCNNGVLQCLDFVNTTLNDCDFSMTPFGDVVFNEDCSVYTNCSCRPQNLTLAFNFTLPMGAGEGSDVVSNGIIADVLFDLGGLDLPFEQGDQVFFPCAATESMPGANMTLNPNLSLDDLILGAQLCPVFENTTDVGNCTEFMSCACPGAPCDRVSTICDEAIQEGLSCQNGRAVCLSGFSFTNFSVIAGELEATLGGEANPNATTGGLVCSGPALEFCGCPALNISSLPDGTVVSIELIPQSEIDEDTMLVGGNFSGLMWMIQTSYNFSTGGVSNFTCEEGRVFCDCNTVVNQTAGEGLCYDINNCSKAYHLDNVPDSAEIFQIFNNVAEGLPIGLHIERISYELVARSSYKVPRFYTDQGTLHEIVRQNNEGITGTINDTISGRKDFWKFMVCNDGCPMNIPTELVNACGVDQRFNADTLFFGLFRFSRIVPAIQFCPFDNIIVHRSINVYEEQIIFNRTNLYFLTLNSAVILRSNHSIAADNCTVRGFVMIHPAENQLPLLRPNSASLEEFSFLNFDLAPNLDTIPPKNFSALNNIMKGNGVSESGSVVGEFGTFFVFRYNVIENFLSRAVDVFAPDPDISFNYFDTIFGRSIRARGTYAYTVICNVFVNCRGIAEGSGVDIVSLEAANILFQFGQIADFQDVESVTVSESEITETTEIEDIYLDERFGEVVPKLVTCNETNFCFVAGNVQAVSEDVRDLSDTFIRIAGGGITVPQVRDNAASKAETGIYFLWILNITFEERFEVYRYNPLIRVADVQHTLTGSDFLFRRPGSLIDLECSFPDCRDFMSLPAEYEVNKNFGHLITPFYGVNEFNNVTAADRYASIINYTNYTHVDYAIRVSQVNGSRLSREQILLRRPIAYFGDRFPCGLKPAIYGSGHEINTWYANATDMEYRYDDYAPQTGLQLWLTPLFSRVYVIIFRGCCFVGRYQAEAGRIHIADFTLQQNNGTFIFQDNLIYDWYHLRDDVRRLNRKRMVEGRPIAVLEMEDGSERQLDLVSSTSGIYAKWHNGIIIPRRTFNSDRVQDVNQNLTTLALVSGNHFFDIDGRALSIENVHSSEIVNNSLINVGMRRDDESAGIFSSGLLDSNGTYIFSGNFYNQTRSMLFPQVGTIRTTPGGTSGGAPTHFAAFWLHQMCNATVWQFQNNTAVVFTPQDVNCTRGTSSFTTHGRLDSCLIRGADYGVRFSSICNETFFLNIPDDEVVYFPEFRPEQVGLRQLALQDNEEVKGTVCDMILCQPFSDIFWSTRSFRRDCTCCRNGCRVPPPNRCIVDRDNSTFVPGNPFLGSYFFISLNDAVVNCTAPSRIIEVRKQQTPYVEQLVLEGEGFFFISGTMNIKNVFTERDTVNTIPSLLWPGQTAEPGLDNRAVFRTANVKVNAPGLIFQNILWQHNGAGPTITTDLSLLSNITFLNNTFEGEGTYQPAFQGSFLNITFTGNSWRDYAGPFAHDVTSGCTSGFLTMLVNSFRRMAGEIRYVNLNGYLVRGNIFVNSGCRHAGPISMILLRACLDSDWNVLSSGPMRFEDNISTQPDSSGIIEMPDGVGYCTSYYLDGVPSNQSSCFAFRNSAEGHPVGLRVDHIPDRATNESNVIGNRPQLTLQFIYSLCANVFVNGSWHSIVSGPPEDDPDIMNDPINNANAVCDNGCPYEQNYWGLVLIFFPIVMIVSCCCFFSIIRNEPRIEYVYSPTLGASIPKDRKYWPQLKYVQDARTGEMRPMDSRDFVTRSELAARRFRQIKKEQRDAEEDSEYFDELEREHILDEVDKLEEEEEN